MFIDSLKLKYSRNIIKMDATNVLDFVISDNEYPLTFISQTFQFNKHKEERTYKKGTLYLEMIKYKHCFKLFSHREKHKNNRCNIIALVYAGKSNPGACMHMKKNS